MRNYQSKNEKLIALLITILCFIGCSDNHSNIPSEVELEASAIADSLDEPDQFIHYIDVYSKKNEKRCELYIRQKYGKYLRDNSMFDEAINQHDTCISIAQEIKDTIQLIIAFNNQGTNYRRLGDLKDATDQHYAALDLCEKMSNDTSSILKKHTTRTLNGLGNVLLSLKNYDAAEGLFRKAFDYELKAKNLTGMAINLANIGSVKEYKNQPDSALTYYKQSLEYNINSNNSVGMSLCYMYIGKIYEDQKENNEALKYYQKSFDIGVPTGDSWHWLEPCISLSNLYLKENKVDSAAKYIDLGIKTANEIHSIDHLARIYLISANLHEKRGNNAQAIKDIHLSQAYYDSISLNNSQVHMQNMRVNHETNKVKAAEERAQNEEYVRNIIIIFSSLIIFLAIVAILLMHRVITERRKTSLANEKVAKERQEFYRGVTHQLRTPLTVVLGMTQQLSKYLPKGDAMAQREFDAVNRQCQQLLTLVTEMIEFSKKGSIREPLITEFSTDRSEENIAKLQREIKMLEKENDEENDSSNYILIAEDDPDVALLITEMLKNEGYRFAWAKDGQEAWEMMHDKLPELLITDIMMPRLDGLQLMKNIRSDESVNHTPIIVVSARVENEDRLTGIEAGAEVYLGKPFLPNELLLRIRKLLEQRAILRNKFCAHIQTIKSEEVNHTSKATVAHPTVQVQAPVTKAETKVTEPKVVVDSKPKSETVVLPMNSVPTSEAPIINKVKEDEDESMHEMTNKERAFIANVDECILNNIDNSDLSSALLAEMLNTTTSTLNRKLKNITDIDTTHYIRMHRIAKAKDCLQNTDMTMVEIQTACGFETPSYFSRSFKADVGITPSEYRKNIQRN